MRTCTRMNGALIVPYLVVCAALLLSGCSSGQTGGTHAKASPTVTIPLPTPTSFTVNLTPLSMQQAWGQVHISQFSLDLGDRYFAPNAQDNGITDDDQACGNTFPMQSRSVDTSQYIDSIGLIDLHTGHITLLATLPTGYLALACTVTGPWVIWMQAYSNTSPHWMLKAFNRQNGEVRLLDQGNGPSGLQPEASNGRVVWTMATADTSGATQSEIYTFATGTKTVLAPQTSGPRISWPWVSWTDGVAKAIVFTNLETAQQVRLPMPYSPTTVAFAGTSFVYTNDDYSQVTLVPSILAQPMGSYVIEDKQTDGSDFDEFPTLNERLVSWVGPHSWLVFDRKLQRPVKIAIGANGFDGDISSHYLVASPPSRRRTLMLSARVCPFTMCCRPSIPTPCPSVTSRFTRICFCLGAGEVLSHAKPYDLGDEVQR